MAVTGAAGMLGQEVCRSAPQWVTLACLTRADGDLTVAAQARRALQSAGPEIIIHCAAWTDVDGATRDPEAAWQANAVATEHVVEIAAELDARLLYLSTDYVFSGADGPYVESDAPSPINPYGESKLAGERAAAELPAHLIVRTQWLYGPGGRNFVEAILDAARQGRPLRVVENEHGCPTYAPDLAEALWQLLQTEARGVVHVVNQGVCSRLELARAALEEAGLDGVEVTGIASEQWPSPTRRPLNAVLASERLDELGLSPLRPWQEALRDYVAVLRRRWQQ
ncbi:MAG: dTDP-4-dehydrorhamnose reductase [Armatimonadota bacterium]|nr:dTDP-4-dehydrorhamnose reductase [Armatimonadota bacterium]